jgi:hypothetical protein
MNPFLEHSPKGFPFFSFPSTFKLPPRSVEEEKRRKVHFKPLASERKVINRSKGTETKIHIVMISLSYSACAFISPSSHHLTPPL